MAPLHASAALHPAHPHGVHWSTLGAPELAAAIAASLLMLVLLAGSAHADLNLLYTIPLNNPQHGCEPWGIAADRSGTRVYAACLYGPWNLIVLDIPTGSVITGAPLAGPYPHGVEVNAAGDRVFVTSSGGTVSIVDAHTLQELRVVPLPGAPMDLCVREAVAGDAPKLYVVDMDGARVWALDAATGQLLVTIPVGFYPYDACYVAPTDRVYAANLSSWTVSVIDASADTVMATVPVGAYPEGIAADPGLNRIYTANRDDGTVSVIDGMTNTVIATYPVGLSPTHLAVDPGTHVVYVVNTDSRDVSVINPVGPSPAPVPVGLHPRGGICVHPALGKVFVTNHQSNDITVFNAAPPWNTATLRLRIDPGSVTLAKPFAFGGPHVHTVAVGNAWGNDVLHLDPWHPPSVRDYDAGYVVSDIDARRTDGLIAATVRYDDTLMLYDGDLPAAIDTIAVGREPVSVAMRADRRVAYVCNHEDMTVAVVDLDAGAVTDTIGFDYWPMDLAIDETTDRLYVTVWMGLLFVIDGTTHEILEIITIPSICEPNQIAVDEARNLIYIAALNGNVMWVYDGQSHQLLRTIGLPDFPAGVAVNEALQRAYVCAGAQLVAIGPQHTIVETLPLPADDIRCVAADPGTSRLYVTGTGPGGGVLFAILDGDPSAVPTPAGGEAASLGRGRIRLSLAAGNPVHLGRAVAGARLDLYVGGGAAPSVGVYDAAGRLVRALLDAGSCGSCPGPRHYQLEWSGGDQCDSPVASGVYFVLARSHEGSGCTRDAARLDPPRDAARVRLVVVD